MRLIRYTLALAFGFFLAIPLSAQTDTAAKTILTDLRRACSTKSKLPGYLCDDTTLAKRLVAPAPIPTPIPTPVPPKPDAQPTPVPVPPPTPTPAPVDTTHQAGDAELPRVFLNTAVSNTPSNGATFHVGSGGDVQAVLDSVQCGDRIALAAGQSFRGNPVYRKACPTTAYITIATEGCATTPSEGTRANIANAACYAKLVAADGSAPALKVAPGASGLRVMGVEFTVPAGTQINYGIVMLGGDARDQTTLAQVPRDLILDRVYVHGVDGANVQRCIALNAARAAVIDSYVSDCHFKGQDAQAIVGWNGPGPFKIVNNYLEGSGENILFGGADPAIQGMNPGDIEVRRNWIRKPLEWKGVWTAKNLFEIKNGVRVLLEGNVLENSWTDAQVGQAIVMQALSDNNTAAWTTVQDVTVRLNIVRGANVGAAIASRAAYGQNALTVSQPSQRITFQHNVFQNMTGGNLFVFGGDLRNASLIHNTAYVGGADLLLFHDDPEVGFVMRDNVFSHLWFGIYGDGVGEGWPALTKYAPDARIVGNVFFSDGPPGMQPFNPDLYPSGNFFPATAASVGFAADQSLSASSPYKGKGTDGKDPGADVAAVMNAVAGVVRP